MNSIMQSIKPFHCGNIAVGKKTYEVRKTRPKLKPPFKVYIYETKDKNFMNLAICVPDKNTNFIHAPGKVIGEYICDEIINLFALSKFWYSDEIISATCLTPDEIRKYANGADKLYGYHITNLKIYDEPKELSDFYTICNKNDLDQCGDCKYIESYSASFPCEDGGDWWCTVDNKKPLTRPPQSWCYCEEVAL